MLLWEYSGTLHSSSFLWCSEFQLKNSVCSGAMTCSGWYKNSIVCICAGSKISSIKRLTAINDLLMIGRRVCNVAT